MPNTMISTDPINSRSFFLDFPNLGGFVLSSVGGLDVKLDVVPLAQNGPNGKQEHIKVVGGVLEVPEINVSRMAPRDAGSDKLWTWFLDIRDKGMSSRTDQRQDGSIVFYDSAGTEVGRYNIFGCWPSSISTSELKTDSNEPLTENITFQAERIERAVK